MKKQFIGYPTVPTDDAGFFYRAAEADAKFKEYDDDNLALSQSVVKLGARIEELRQAFTRYGRHTGPCLDSGHRACICGYAETFKSLMER